MYVIIKYHKKCHLDKFVEKLKEYSRKINKLIQSFQVVVYFSQLNSTLTLYISI